MPNREKLDEILVQKYGGTSVATPERINQIAERISRTVTEYPRLVVVLSAMGKSVTLSHDKAQSKITIIPKFDKNLILGIMIEIYKLF